jgi:hypothetical protein
MFKQQAVTKLPTFLQFMKEQELKETDFSSQIKKILWGDQWKSITFQTDDFRYSVKFNSEEEYKDACRQVLDAFQPNAYMRAWINYESETGEVEVDWVCTESDDPSEGIIFKQFDWGIVHDAFEKFKPRPSSKKKPSAKLTKPPKSEEPPF